MLRVLNQNWLGKFFVILIILLIGIQSPSYADIRINSENVQNFLNSLESFNVNEVAHITTIKGISHVKTYQDVIDTECGATQSIAYCPSDQTIYLNIPDLNQFVNIYGDNALYLVIGHEWGHHFLAQIGYMGPNIGEELAADCISGYVFGHFHQLTMGELSKDELVRLILQTVGAGDTSGYVSSHGMGEQRATYLYRGLKAIEAENTINACFE